MTQETAKILIIDDDPRVVQLLTLALEEEGLAVSAAYSGKEGLRAAYALHPDLILLDIMMPVMDGFEVLDNLRLMTDVPILMLTSAGFDENRIRGMDKGAADFITKGISTRALLSHIQARLRAYQRQTPSNGPRRLGDHLEVDLARRAVRRGGKPVTLTPLQWRLLRCLLECEGRVATYDDLLRAGWDNTEFRDARAVKVQISQLRGKLGDSAHASRYIHTVREEGYLFEVRL